MKKGDSKGNGGVAVIFIIMVIIVIAIVGIVMVKNKKEKVVEGEVATSVEDGAESEESLDTIDYQNLDNAKFEDGVKVNTSSKISDTKKINDLVLSNIKLEANNGISNFTAEVKNNGGDFAGSNATIRFLNSSGEEYAFLETFIPEIRAGETNSINAGIIADIVNAYDYTIELHD